MQRTIRKTAVAPKKAIALVKVKKKVFTSFRTSIFSRHPSHSPLRRQLPLLPFRSVVRLGSTTPSLPGRIECNTIAGVRNSSSKLLMKRCFTRVGVKTAQWLEGDNTPSQIGSMLGFPLISKTHNGSRGNGNTKFDTQEQFNTWCRGKTLSNYVYEKFVKMDREYRLHVTNNGCFYACRKLLKNDAPEGTWQKHDTVVNWAMESNPSFKKPRNWGLIVEDCIKAKNALGLDICAFDVMVQGSKEGVERTNPEWIVVESCSAPSFGEVTLQKYIEEIPKILKSKYAQR